MEMGKSGKKRILLKIGTNTLTKESNHISRGKLEDLARQIAKLQDQYEFIIVSSGAIAVARQFVNLESNGTEINVKQALASIGQPHLMRIFQESFREFGLLTSQCLLSYLDFDREETKMNIKNTIEVLLANHYIPIINENDTVATHEIQFGDNDKLGALTAALLQVDLFMIATNTDGIYTKHSLATAKKETIRMVTDITTLEKEVSNHKSSHGTGGMQSKIEAAAIAQQSGIPCWIVNGLKDHFITDALASKSRFTTIRTKA